MPHEKIPDAVRRVEGIERRPANGVRQRFNRVRPVMTIALDRGEENFRLMLPRPIAQDAHAIGIADDFRRSLRDAGPAYADHDHGLQFPERKSELRIAGHQFGYVDFA